MISENTVSEKKVLPHKGNANGREEFLELKDLYEGVRKNAKAVLAANNGIQELYYAGKNKPQIWWSESERKIN